jgi:hypothetical protein
MVEQCEVMESELARGVPDQRLELRQVAARVRGVSKLIAEPPQERCLARVASRSFAKHLLLVNRAFSHFRQISY